MFVVMDLSISNILRQARDKYSLDPAAFARGLGNYATDKPSLPSTAKSSPLRSPEEQAMFDLKAQLITQARVKAKERGEQFSLEHYRKECELFAASEKGQKLAAASEEYPNGRWNPKIYADLSGQNLDGIRLSNPKAVKLGSTNKPEYELTPATQADYDSFDRDGDGKINNPAIGQFYDEIRLNGASLREAFVEPATSFNEEVAKAKDLQGLTFSGMAEGDRFTFGAGAHYQNVRLENVQGGNVTFNGTVDGITISGKSASIAVGDHARISDIKTSDGFSIIHLDVGTGAVISNADLSKSTISMTSHFEPGSSLQNVTLSGNVNGLDLSGVHLRNVAIDGKAITSLSQLPEGVAYDARTTASASQEFIMQMHAKEALGAGVKDFSWNPDMRQASAPSPSTPAPQEIAAAASNDPLAAIRATMQGQLQTIGNPLTEQERLNLKAIEEARGHPDNSLSLAPRR